MSKLMLEMLARRLNTSLAQAAEYAIQKVASKTEIYRDTSIEFLAKDGLVRLYHRSGKDTQNSIARPLGGAMTDAERAIALPSALRTPAEEYFHKVIEDLAINYYVYPLADREQSAKLLEHCILGQFTGTPEFKIVELWLVDHPAPEPPPYVRTAPPSGPSIPKPEKKKR
ncbi:hypothetical protein [Eoetvoesiella caeni]